MSRKQECSSYYYILDNPHLPTDSNSQSQFIFMLFIPILLPHVTGHGRQRCCNATAAAALLQHRVHDVTTTSRAPATSATSSSTRASTIFEPSPLQLHLTGRLLLFIQPSNLEIRTSTSTIRCGQTCEPIRTKSSAYLLQHFVNIP